jgi:hypothetical protein
MNHELGPADHMRSCIQETIITAKVLERCRGLAMRPSLSVSFQICGNSLVATACIWMFECSISMQWAPLKLKHSEYLQGIIGDQLTICAAAARSNQLQNGQSLWELQWVGLAPQPFPFKFAGTCTVWELQHAYECLSATFQCSARPFETF